MTAFFQFLSAFLDAPVISQILAIILIIVLILLLRSVKMELCTGLLNVQ